MLPSTPNILLGTNFRLNTHSEFSLSNRKHVSKSVLDSRENLLKEFKRFALHLKMFIDNGRKENIGCISSFKEFTFVVEMRQVWSSENLRELLYSYVRKEKSHREERGQSLDFRITD